MTKIKLLLLEGCNRCENLKDQLDKKGINYDYEVCKSDTELCDSIEDMIGCSSYPIVLKLNGLYNVIEEVVYITDDYEEVGKSKFYTNKIKLNMVHSIDSLLNYIING